MGFRLVDAHAHINSEFYPDDYRQVLERARENGIAVVNIGTNRKDSEENVRIAEELGEGIYAAVGLHPTEKEDLPDGRQGFDYEFYSQLAQKKQVVAIGECGLDYNKLKVESSKLKVEEARFASSDFKKEKERQREIFEKQIELAIEVQKPLMLHLRTKEAYDDAIEIIEQKKKEILRSAQNDITVVFHFYSGNKEQTEKIFKMDNAYVTIGGVITFPPKADQKTGAQLDEIIKMIPLERIMLETDSPFVAPEPYRGKRNEPVYVVETAKKLVEIKGVSFEEVERMTTETANKVLGLGI